MIDEEAAHEWLEATYDPDLDPDEVFAQDGGTIGSTESATVKVFEDDIRDDLPPGFGYEDDDNPERNRTWNQKK